MKKQILPALTILVSFLTTSSYANQQTTDYDKLAQQIRSTLESMVAADTTNPPGNEERIVKIAQRRYKEAGIPYEITEFAPGRQNIVARLKATQANGEKPVLLLAHIDVVGAANQKWSFPPHKVSESEGYLYGRGVSDDLGMAAISMEMLVHLKKTAAPLRRDVIVALTGDEESGGAGIQYILKNKPESISAAFALNEGGGLGLGTDGKVKLVSMQVAEKIYQDYELVATGPTGHSSVPLKENAIYKLARALDRLGKHTRPARLIPATRAYYLGRSQVEKPPLSTAMKKLAEAKGKLPSDALKILEADPIQAASLRTTCVATLLSGGTRENALPSEAKANVNCRILPDESKEQIQAELIKIIDDPNIAIKLSDEMGAAPASDEKGEAAVAILKIAQKYWPGVPLVPSMSKGATDSRFLRAHGIPSYGFSPIPSFEEDGRRAHGIDERIPVASLRTGAEYFHELLLEMASTR